MNIEHNGRIALVTGATRGIGAAIADQLAASGAFVIGTATSDNGAAAIDERLGERGIGVKLNVTDRAECEQLVKDITANHGTIEILVNNAGITRDGLLMRMSDDDWDAIINTNLTPIFRLSKLVMRGMMKAKFGRIISISSVVGSMGNPGQANYAAAKAAVNGFTRSLAKEIGSRGVTVNTVAPGFIVSDMTNELPEAQRAELASQIATGRLGEPSEIADAVTFIASDRASYITGQTIHVNGGMFMS
ncbi:MAG: 3-oxoacyl-ACP reductase FabG [Gammaproteobacteria bacterium]|nr:3-oxoacyl-ACP reductase FabG [Gammaproteobacteria bacterium]